jgi:hypothetical protein
MLSKLSPQKQLRPGNRVTGCSLWIMAAIVLTLSPSLSATATTTCTTGALPPGSGENLIVSGGTCTVKAGTYQYQNVNIISGGTLLFLDTKIDFWAQSILIESAGSLVAGTAAAPIGTNGGVVTIHLWGADQGTSGTAQGIPCATPTNQNTGPCGIPLAIWTSNVAGSLDPTSCSQNTLPGGVTDCFYQYMPLDYDGGGNPPGYFGYKVIGVSYGGTLQLFGKKGATYATLPPSSSGKSWARLSQSINATANRLVLDRKVDWQAGDRIVLTSTDYLPGHTEILLITNIASDQRTITFVRDVSEFKDGAACAGTGACFAHNGTTYDTSSVPSGIGPDQDPNIACSVGQKRCVETRAAVGLLTRSIRIVSGGDTLMSSFPGSANCMSGNPPTCNTKPGSCYYFGGHTLVRQGFQSFQMQGVEFYQLGQGGRIMHYPVHFHMARLTPPSSYVMDSSVWDSMTRWYTIHGTEGVTLARNVGALSIGHGYYLEDGTETNNKLYGNLGVFARAAVINDENPRCVPGILAATHQVATDQVPYSTDMDHPTSFWIMNGWNDFQYNAAAGDGSCGMCYWLTPGGNSGNSRYEYWTSYASEQQVTQSSGGDDYTRAGTTPLMNFVGNTCSTAQNAFFTIGPSAPCFGVDPNGDPGAPLIPSVSNPLAPAPTSQAADNYYPKINQSGARFPTECPSGSDCTCNTVSGCPSGLPGVPVCDPDSEQYCTVTALDHFTTSFNWADTGFAAIWLRQQWYLLSNSAITDVQNGGVTFVSGGGYTNSDEIPGYWALAHKNVFVGTTQPSNHFASNAGPFNYYSGLKCGLRTDNGQPNAAYCVNANEGISMPLENFALNQRLLSIYDGPSFQDSDAFMDVTSTTLTGCTPGNGVDCQTSGWMYGNSLGLPQDSASQTCYLPNAAIAWKQSNAFYYPPEFHSKNLYFNTNVDIRHFVIEPLFQTGSYNIDPTLPQQRYCVQNSAMFNNFTDIDRQTELSDDDGSLTGLLGGAIPQSQTHLPAISVNKDAFFNAPMETVECASDILDNMPQPWDSCGQGGSSAICGTANTSPYDYVTTVVYPDCGNSCDQSEWNISCETQACVGVPLYREGLVPSDNGAAPFIRMAGQATGQRSTLTVNHGNYYMDTNVSQIYQNGWNPPGGLNCTVGSNNNEPCTNVFEASHSYYTFLLFAKPTTVQNYSMYVGTDFNPADTTQLWVARVNKGSVPYTFAADSAHTITECSSKAANSTFPWCYSFDSSSGILSVTMNMGFSDFAQNYATAVEQSCQPQSYCTWNSTSKSCGCALSSTDPGYSECKNACSNWAGKSIDCPWDSTDFTPATGACYGFGVKLPSDFAATGNGTSSPPGQCLPDNSTWNLPFTAASSGIAGGCTYTSGTLPTGSFCRGSGWKK